MHLMQRADYISAREHTPREGLAARAYNDTSMPKLRRFSNPGEIGEAQYTNIIARLSAEENYPGDLLVGEEGRINQQ